jgi:TetR/AcrR family transcriptional regulator, regulator of autoinduction and epiphytic fitness
MKTTMKTTISPPSTHSAAPLRESSKPPQILRGAMQEFLARGYAAASMDRVAAAAGVSKATIYSHFGDKETLFKALVEQMAKQRMQSILSHMDETLEPRQALRSLFQEAIVDCCNNTEFHDFHRMLVGESGRFPELATTFVEHLCKPGIEALSEYFQRCPDFDFPDPAAIARIVVGGIVHFGLVQHILHGEAIIPMESDRVVAGLEYLLFPPSGRSRE